ncbi:MULTISPECIES: HD family phosphohydrolase [Gammaproteobacteria]|uniref:HD family phosphohydrolase n=1 Tax=Gammaproteobacteria TaxID=1236 RepID=UPI000DD0996C|nr:MULTISPECIES: HD family phosphohydrolase [Gammaproteobacteria]RTE87728.1 GAF domain-containing protein [Aliidiomarina sp. B3213]TCZ92490.1 GAF domain-containing protein [Lysobacter sp. N42]
MTATLDVSTELKLVKRLNEIGIALSAESDEVKLLELILSSTRDLTSADGGTLYIVKDDEDAKSKVLQFKLVQNDTLGVKLGGTGDPIDNRFPDLPCYLESGEANNKMVAVHAVVSEQTINIADAYEEEGFDFSGTKKFDETTGYRSKSMLVVPMRNHENEVIAAIQLLNKQDDKGNTITFDEEDLELVSSLASQAAIALTNRRLIDDLHHLFDSFTQVIASAIDAKSPQTGAHCRRVPDATIMIAEAASGSDFPGIEGFEMSEEEMYELRTAAWMHDCGKIVTPPHVVEKSTKLETINDRIHAVEARLERIRMEYKVKALEAKANNQPEPEACKTYNDAFFKDTLAFLRTCNKGSEFTEEKDLSRLQELSELYYTDIEGQKHPLITPNELENLSIRRGTLTDEERQIMEDHMVHTINMLSKLPFPKHLRRVPEFAGGHHERMDGSGYPLGLTREQMSVPARIMGIADVFEALTAPERTYKKPMPLSQTLNIMSNMVLNSHLDPDLFKMFVEKKVYLRYAEKYLTPEQIDDVAVDEILGKLA